MCHLFLTLTKNLKMYRTNLILFIFLTLGRNLSSYSCILSNISHSILTSAYLDLVRFHIIHSAIIFAPTTLPFATDKKKHCPQSNFEWKIIPNGILFWTKNNIIWNLITDMNVILEMDVTDKDKDNMVGIFLGQICNINILVED